MKLNACSLLLAAATWLPATLPAQTGIPGITEPILDVTLSTPVAGIVGSRPVKEGDFVREGQVIIELDKKLEELEAARRKIIVEKNKTEFEATQILFTTTKSVSKDELDKIRAEYQVAEAEYEIAAEQLRKRQVISPTSGYVTEIFREVGEACQANEKLIRVVDTRRCYFVCNIEARAGADLQPGQTVRLEVEAGRSTLVIEGVISFVSPVVDPASGLLRIKAIFDNTGGKVRPGVAGKLLLEEKHGG